MQERHEELLIRIRGNTDNETMVELALEMVDNVGAGGHVGRNENVGPVICPSWIILIVICRRRYLLQLLWILSFFSHLSLSAKSMELEVVVSSTILHSRLVLEYLEISSYFLFTRLIFPSILLTFKKIILKKLRVKTNKYILSIFRKLTDILE